MKSIRGPSKIKTLVLFAIVSVSLISCSKEYKDNLDIIDYSIAAHWLSLPVQSKEVDIFYVYPTAWQKGINDSNLCEINNASMLAGAKSAYSIQATAFEPAGNVFAPYYRQADATYTLSLPDDKRWELISGTPSKDVTTAFEYYIEHFNNGRPFVLAGHSQGANVLLVLLSEYMKEHPDVYKRMVAAYVIGYPVTAAFLAANPHLKFATGPDDTGVIISYNTQSTDVSTGGNIVVGDNIGLVINPISWTRSETVAAAEQSLGSYMPDANGHFVKVQSYADARVDIYKGVLICSTANEDDLAAYITMGKGVYHFFDYPFYYYNLRENAINRINKYLSK